MPRATHRYRFEMKILQWGFDFSLPLTGDFCRFVMIFNDTGVINQVLFGHTIPDGFRDAHGHWLFFDPFDAPEWTFVEWRNLDRSIFERMMKQPFAPDDFVSFRLGLGERLNAFPITWSVMF
jgi:hypothetical protein